MMLENGAEFGCLRIVSNDFRVNYQNFINSIKPIAEFEWTRFENWTSKKWAWEKDSDTFINGCKGENCFCRRYLFKR